MDVQDSLRVINILTMFMHGHNYCTLCKGFIATPILHFKEIHPALYEVAHLAVIE